MAEKGFNLSILECKCNQVILFHSNPACFNLSILECKYRYGQTACAVFACFNLSILECKYYKCLPIFVRHKVLIYPYWNVNKFLTRNGMDGILFLYFKPSNQNRLPSRAFAHMYCLMCPQWAVWAKRIFRRTKYVCIKVFGYFLSCSRNREICAGCHFVCQGTSLTIRRR